ncbi:CMRF35-like molecule 8 isoform X1 [Rattus norvegicus]|uniref:CMRF35-like molecule 8 isoform X1 n=1 Tax=Rattus norvegicus TaxID=10116 RepID=UPI001917219A|nr:CMRF35-like molecule 8 isoform X1 [Rattus norvegicus]
MTQLASAVWLPTLLLLLLFWVPGCVPLRGPSSVTGTVGESLNVTCQYEERFKMNKKYWCRGSLVLLCKDIVKTGGSEEARNGRVSIRDDRDNLTFTVTLQNLTLEDAGTYMCAVDIPLIDHSFKVELSVVPGNIPVSSPGTTRETTVVPTSFSTKGPTQGSIPEGHHEHYEPQGLSLPVLLSVLALLLLLLVGTSLLAWRMFQKRSVKGSRNSRPMAEVSRESLSQSSNPPPLPSLVCSFTSSFSSCL